jgi:glycerate dehydrogenase
VERLHRASICITNKIPLRAAALAQLSWLRLIAVAATGTDIVDLDAAKARGITVCNIRGYAETTVPEHVLGLLFALRRNLLAYASDVQNGAWQRSAQFCAHLHEIRDLAGSTLGVIGYGVLGQAVARRAEALGMRVLAYDVRRADGLVDFDTVLRESDAITLHLPLTPETHGMIGADELSRMQPHALLINTARGGLVDEPALAAALRAGTLAGAGVDVLSAEPPAEGNVLLAPDIPNLIVTPHVAWASQQAQAVLAEQLVGNLEAFCRGAPRNVVA